MASVPKPKPKPKAAVPKAKPKQRKRKLPAGYNPITRQPREKQSGLGFVAGGGVNLDNITRMGREASRARTAGDRWKQMGAAKKHRSFDF